MAPSAPMPIGAEGAVASDTCSTSLVSAADLIAAAGASRVDFIAEQRSSEKLPHVHVNECHLFPELSETLSQTLGIYK